MFSTLERSLIFEKKKKNRKRDGACLCRVENALCDVLSIFERERERVEINTSRYFSLFSAVRKKKKKKKKREKRSREPLEGASLLGIH